MISNLLFILINYIDITNLNKIKFVNNQFTNHIYDKLCALLSVVRRFYYNIL